MGRVVGRPAGVFEWDAALDVGVGLRGVRTRMGMGMSGVGVGHGRGGSGCGGSGIGSASWDYYRRRYRENAGQTWSILARARKKPVIIYRSLR